MSSMDLAAVLAPASVPRVVPIAPKVAAAKSPSTPAASSRSVGKLAAPATRSVDAIRSAYGRAKSGADRGATAVAAAAADARDRLVERGERLRSLEQRSEALESEAASFGDLAAELNKQQKWWL